MLRFNIPVDVWMCQPDGVIETAIDLVNEWDEQERKQQGRDGGSFSG